MRSMDSIRITFHEAGAQAKALKDSAEEINKAARQLDRIISSLGGGWKGEAADQYIRKCQALKEKMERSARHVNDISHAVYDSAKAYYDAEREAIQIARQRSYGGGGGGGGFR